MATSEAWTIRPVRLDDVDQLHALRRRPAIARHLLFVPAEERSTVKTGLEETTFWTTRLVADRAGVVAGYGEVAVRPRPRVHGEGKLRFFVHPELRQQGIGSALLAALLEVADGWYNLTRVTARTFTFSAAARALLESHGFEREALLRSYALADGVPADVVLLARLHGVDSAVSVAPPLSKRAAVISSPEFNAAPTAEGMPFIRPLRADDMIDLHAFFSDPRVGRFTGQMPGAEVELIRQRLATTRPGIYRYVADVSDRAVGLASLYVEQNPRRVHAGGLGMMVHPDFWGRGIGTQLMAAICDLADNWLGLRRMELEVNVDNPPAIRLYEKFGFVHEGVARYHIYGDGRWAHSYLMGRVGAAS